MSSCSMVPPSLHEVGQGWLPRDDLDDECLRGLCTLYSKPTCIAALDLIDRRKIKQVIAPSGRSFYVVQGKEEQYLCLRHYCSCQGFARTLANREEATCKHCVAARVAQLVTGGMSETVSEQEFTLRLIRLLGAENLPL
eukprot:TRINITY_DN11553_c0_g1_i2.p1 TRINITY_DN11553_c0_g1~~TRINITY_DN11553_c0_g1_i2.p1  ORF type:complete len:139 (+),score=20.50 TRINITY_DN11553_c0_g1_i2:179-595(+)